MADNRGYKISRKSYDMPRWVCKRTKKIGINFSRSVLAKVLKYIKVSRIIKKKTKMFTEINVFQGEGKF